MRALRWPEDYRPSAYGEARKSKGVAGAAEAKRLLVLGAGFGGMTAAREFARLVPDDECGEIILVDERGFHLFTAMLTEVAGGELRADIPY